ncbi:hypothetical protein Bp8pC_165 [Bacillus phage Bp8p-C]|uniref:Uncharacterized protein n=2 Tax=Agatevirus Bp8pC TaxID=1910937 RepID=A0A0A0PLJ5_9CAUD|nr:hypothetical protein AXJ20_gp183 [Bacillus phage Bp8p-C]YP_009784465.1 hypothetical protein QLX39_gp183 [Bacillus phage Bp8p-T]AHJ87595.1 hypothetical protein Bp8pC_165 [Bacillus phage Bp8p-C]AHJ87806.1 hypothetical protein Bp8pT_165 [Bacillus phage Bp8p-T]
MALINVECERCGASYKKMVDYVRDCFWDSEDRLYYHKCYLDEGTEVGGQMNSDILMMSVKKAHVLPKEGDYVAIDDENLSVLILGSVLFGKLVSTSDKEFLKAQTEKYSLNDYSLYKVIDTSKNPVVVLKRVDWES